MFVSLEHRRPRPFNYPFASIRDEEPVCVSPAHVPQAAASLPTSADGSALVVDPLCQDCRQIDLLTTFTNADEYFEANWDLTLGLREWRGREGPDAFAGLLVAGLGPAPRSLQSQLQALHLPVGCAHQTP